MRTQDIPEYAEHVVGFPISVGMTVIVEEECIGTGDDGKSYTSEKGAQAIVTSIGLLPIPDQLTVCLSIEIDAEKKIYIQEIFTEKDAEPQFPFVVPKTQEQLELERAEAAAKKEAEGQKSGGRAQQEQPGPWQDGEEAGQDPFHRYPGFGCH